MLDNKERHKKTVETNKEVGSGRLIQPSVYWQGPVDLVGKNTQKNPGRQKMEYLHLVGTAPVTRRPLLCHGDMGLKYWLPVEPVNAWQCPNQWALLILRSLKVPQLWQGMWLTRSFGLLIPTFGESWRRYERRGEEGGGR